MAQDAGIVATSPPVKAKAVDQRENGSVARTIALPWSNRANAESTSRVPKGEVVWAIDGADAEVVHFDQRV
jgi:hypothetical protein